MPDILEARILVVGAAGSGKTSLIQRFVNNSFSDVYDPTIGCVINERYYTVESMENQFHVYVWDTCGNSAYSALNHLYYTGSSCAIIVVESNKPESVCGERIKNFLQTIREQCGSIPVLIVKTKSDELQTSLSWTQTTSYAPGVPIVSVSAKNDTNVAHAFKLLLNELVRHQQLVGVRVDVPVHRLRDIAS